jgi:hypothetical protein
MTIDKLAIMVAKGFEGVATKEDLKNLEARMATKEDIKDMATKTDIEGINKRIDDFAETKVSKITYKELENRVQKIEAKI